jgi:hypothetical protein
MSPMILIETIWRQAMPDVTGILGGISCAGACSPALRPSDDPHATQNHEEQNSATENKPPSCLKCPCEFLKGVNMAPHNRRYPLPASTGYT